MIGWLAENLVWASAAMLLVLTIRGPVARLLGAGAAYALWLIPLFRLIAPPGDWLAAVLVVPFPSLPPLLLPIGAGGGAAPPPPGGPGQWAPILLAVWAGGAILFLGLQAVRYRLFLRRLGRSMRSAGSHRGVPLVESAAVDGPLAVGLLDRKIVLPADFADRYAPEERALALDHERYHHRRGDILANHLALLVLAINWFNPIAWRAFRCFRADQELSCDAAIVAAGNGGARRAYAQALIKSASHSGLISACPLNGADQLKRRLKMLNQHRKDGRRRWAGSLLTAGLIAGSMMAGTAGQAQERIVDPERHRVLIIETADGAAPAPGTGERGELRIRREDGKVTSQGMPVDVATRLERCLQRQGELNLDAGAAKDRMPILLCSKDGASPANRLQVLEQARERMAGGTGLTAEQRQRLLTELDRAIAAERAN